MGVCDMTDLCSSPGQMSVIPGGTAVVGEVIIQTFGAIDVSMLIPLAFLICREHLFWMLALSLAYKADTQVGGLVSGKSGVFNLHLELNLMYVCNKSTNYKLDVCLCYK